MRGPYAPRPDSPGSPAASATPASGNDCERRRGGVGWVSHALGVQKRRRRGRVPGRISEERRGVGYVTHTIPWMATALPRDTSPHNPHPPTPHGWLAGKCSLGRFAFGFWNELPPPPHLLELEKTTTPTPSTWSSTACQCSTFILTAASASTVARSAGSGRKWRAVSTSRPLGVGWGF